MKHEARAKIDKRDPRNVAFWIDCAHNGAALEVCRQAHDSPPAGYRCESYYGGRREKAGRMRRVKITWRHMDGSLWLFTPEEIERHPCTVALLALATGEPTLGEVSRQFVEPAEIPDGEAD